MNKYMELQYQVERIEDVAVVRCSGRMVRGAALDNFRRRIEQLDRLRVLVLDLSEVQQVDAGGLGTLLGPSLDHAEFCPAQAGQSAGFLAQTARFNPPQFCL